MSARTKYALGTPLWLLAAAGGFHLLGVSWDSIIEFAVVTAAALGIFALGFVSLVALIEGIVSMSERRFDE